MTNPPAGDTKCFGIAGNRNSLASSPANAEFTNNNTVINVIAINVKFLLVIFNPLTQQALASDAYSRAILPLEYELELLIVNIIIP